MFSRQIIDASLISNELIDERICKHKSCVVIKLLIRSIGNFFILFLMLKVLAQFGGNGLKVVSHPQISLFPW